VVVDMRRGYHRSEFGMYRYDVVFRRPSDPAAVDAAADSPEAFRGARYELEPWDPAVHSLAEIERRLVAEAPDYLAFAGLADARLVYEEALVDELDENTRDARVHATAGALRAYLDARAARLEDDLVADTTGAGDAFIGSICHGIATGMELGDAMHLGLYVTAKKCLKLGARPGLP